MNSKRPVPEIIDLRSIHRSAGGGFEHLLRYGEFRYHLLLRFNMVVPDCLENTALNKLYDAVSHDDSASDDCRDLFWQFIESDYIPRSKQPQVQMASSN